MTHSPAQYNEKLRQGYRTNLLCAGVPGLFALLFPRTAEKYIWGIEPSENRKHESRLATRMVGTVWLSVGVLSLMGLRRPRAFSGIFPLQITYKTLWLALVGGPALLQRDRKALPIALGFGGMIAALWSIVPVSEVLDPEKSLGESETAALSKAVSSDRVSPPWSPLYEMDESPRKLEEQALNYIPERI